jgi:hypothetical protein
VICFVRLVLSCVSVSVFSDLALSSSLEASRVAVVEICSSVSKALRGVFVALR